MIRRLNYAMTDGINEAEILVYFLLESFWFHYLPDQQFTHGFFYGAFLQDKKAVEIDRETQLILNGLLSENMILTRSTKMRWKNRGARGDASSGVGSPG